MKAARLHGYGERLVVEDVPTPRPDKGQVVVRIEGAGFCHSDIHVIDGEIRVLPRMPLTLGHENAGRVVAVAAGVRTISEGDLVAVYGGWGCGVCDSCVTGHEQLIGSIGVALDDLETEGWARVHSEQWRVKSPVPVKRGQLVRVTARSDLLLSVLPVTEADQGA